MRTVEDLMYEAAEIMRPVIEEAFQAGRAAGRLEISQQFRTLLEAATADPLSPPRDPVAATVASESNGSEASVTRAPAGSVKPTITQMIRQAEFGLTQAEIEAKTDFKHNSIRGTLWTLQKEGVIERRDAGRYFPVSENTEAADDVPQPGSPTASFEGGVPSGPVKPVPGGGT